MSQDRKILLVDDHEDSRVAVQHLLAPLGYGIVSAPSGEAALKAALHEEFALVLLDVVMPGGMDGLQTAGYLKRLDHTRHIPIVFLTGVAGDIDCESAGFAVGAADFLVKPINPVELRAKVHYLTSLYTETRRLQDEVAELRGTTAALQEQVQDPTERPEARTGHLPAEGNAVPAPAPKPR